MENSDRYIDRLFQQGWHYRNGGSRRGSNWMQEQQLADYEVSNWYVSTHPNSRFVTTLIVARPDVDCRYALQNNKFTTYHLDGQKQSRLLNTVSDLRTILEQVFCLTLPEISGLNNALQQLVE